MLSEQSEPKQNNETHSYFLNSMLNSTSLNVTGLVSSLNASETLFNNLNSLNDTNKIPNANDILGMSYASTTGSNNKIVNLNSSGNLPDKKQSPEQNCINEIVQKQTNDLNKFVCSKRKIEFVGSLLKNEMKVMLKNFSEKINAIVNNDVTDTTTHLVVDSSNF
jgi:hypothetical protein